MKKPIVISIPKPCSEDWNEMTPKEQGRFCDSCQKCVVDFTSFNDYQIHNYLSAHKGERICGRFQNTQLHRTISIPPQPRSMLYRIAIVVGLTLAVSSTPVHSFAQAPLTEHSELIDAPKDEDRTDGEKRKLVAGKVVDENGDPIKHTTVYLMKKGKLIASTVTDDEGVFRIETSIALEHCNLKISRTNYEDLIMKLPISIESIRITLRQVYELQGDIDISTMGMIYIPDTTQTTGEPVIEESNKQEIVKPIHNTTKGKVMYKEHK